MKGEAGPFGIIAMVARRKEDRGNLNWQGAGIARPIDGLQKAGVKTAEIESFRPRVVVGGEHGSRRSGGGGGKAAKHGAA